MFETACKMRGLLGWVSFWGWFFWFFWGERALLLKVVMEYPERLRRNPRLKIKVVGLP